MQVGLFVLVAWTLTAAAQTLRPQQNTRFRPEDILWRDADYELRATSLAGRPQLGYAVLRLRPGSPLLALLPRVTPLAPLPRTLDIQLALVPIDSIQELDRLAPLAHAEMEICGSLEFIPLTYRLASKVEYAPPHYASSANFPALTRLLDQVQLTQIDSHLDTITGLASRFHSHPVGVNAGQTLRLLWQAQVRRPERWQISETTHTNTPQRSVVARLPGLGAPEETVVLGAHLDSIAVGGGGTTAGPAPGADDDASGLSILTEILRVIEQEGLDFHPSIELHAYAAEEIGLVGSREMALAYRQANRRILGMLQFDMAYYSLPAKRGVIHFLEDYTSRDLRRQAVEWVQRYLGPVYERGRLPSGSASDHKAWWEQGYPALFPFQDPEAYNPFIHTPLDTRAQFDDGLLMERMTKLGLLFVSYQAGAENLRDSYQAQSANLLPEDQPRDLHLATSQAADGKIYLALSTPAATSFLEFCQVTRESDAVCATERETLDRAEVFGDRKVYYSTSSLNLEAGQKWRIMAYDASDQLIAWRQIQFE
jgi:leucyl aminopeptidase